MGSHLLEQPGGKWHTWNFRNDGVDPAVWTQSCDTIVGATRLDLLTIDPVHDIDRSENPTAIEAASPLGGTEGLTVAGAKPVEMLLVREG